MGFDISLAIEAEQAAAAAQEARRLARLQETGKKVGAFFSALGGIREVWLFGSILQPGEFSARSDIDIAVAGLPEDRYFKTWAELSHELETDAVDLVELEHCRFAASIRRCGLRLI